MSSSVGVRICQRAFHAAVALCAATALIALLGGTPLSADDIDPVDAGGDALRRGGDLPWYDSDADDIRAVPLHSAADPPERPTEGTTVAPSNSGLEGASMGVGYALQMLGILVLAALIVVVIGLFMSTILSRRQQAVTAGPSLNIVETRVDRMEELPVPLKRSYSDLLAEARRQYEQGNFNEAIIYLYSYLLVELDKAQQIRLLRGKTNRQYLGELRQAPTLRNIIENAMVAFEDAFFGNHQLERTRLESLLSRLDEFHRQLETT